MPLDRSTFENKPFESMLPGSQANSDPNSLLSAKARAEIDEYTLFMRTGTDKIGIKTPLKIRVRRKAEAVNRRIWYKLFRYWFKNPPLEKKIRIEDLESIFVIPYGDAIGDMIVTLPIFRAIKRRNPNVRIGTIISDRNRTLLRCDNDLDDKYQMKGRKNLITWQEIRRARKVGYQVVINMHLNHMTEYGIIANLLSPAGIKVTAANLRKDLYKILFNYMAKFERNSMHLSQLGLEVLNGIIDFGERVKQWETRPDLVMCQNTEERIGARIDEALRNMGAKWYIVFNTQARNPFREWSIEKIQAFSNRFADTYSDGAIFFTSSPVRQGEVESLISSANLKRAMLFKTTYDLLEVSQLCKSSRLVITPDTSIIHFGTAENKPTLTMWTDGEYLPMEWIPICVPSRQLVPKVLGQPVSTIPVDEVWDAAIGLLEGKWTASQTSYDPMGPPDPLYQASLGHEELHELIKACVKIPED